VLRNTIIIGLFIFSFNSFADTYYIKYDDLLKDITITEKFKNSEDFSSRFEELKYINGQSINILNLGNTNISSGKRNQTIDSVKMGGEGVGN
jgi:hypothetical protein